MNVLPKLTVAAFCFLFCACTKKEATAQPEPSIQYDSIPSSKRLTPQLEEVSGIAASKTVPQHLWGEEDSGNPPRLWLIGYDGAVLKNIYIKDAANRDWEDLVLAGNDLYVADIGDNNRVFSEYVIYKFPEPSAAADTVFNIQKIRFQYPDGSHDAEAFLVDPATNDIFIITKRDNPSAIYKIPFPYAATGLNTAVKMGTLPYSGVVSAALSPESNAVLVKTYTALYRYKKSDQSLDVVLQTPATTLSYSMEPQGEAVSFAQDNSGFFTLSEKGLADVVNLYFYRRR